MKVAVTATGSTLDSVVDPRFGRCPVFMLVETDDMSCEAMANESGALGGGAGIQSAQLMARKGVRTVLTGNCGPNAHQTLSAAGIGVVVGCSGTVGDVVRRFVAGELQPASAPNVASHNGMGGSGQR
jgi:predicted Fe-Mo cluster-binding NifX family protein